jgi:hypothetical protein
MIAQNSMVAVHLFALWTKIGSFVHTSTVKEFATTSQCCKKAQLSLFFWGGQEGELYKVIAEQHPKIIALHPLIKRQLMRSFAKASRLAVEEI